MALITISPPLQQTATFTWSGIDEQIQAAFTWRQRMRLPESHCCFQTRYNQLSNYYEYYIINCFDFFVLLFRSFLGICFHQQKRAACLKSDQLNWCKIRHNVSWLITSAIGESLTLQVMITIYILLMISFGIFLISYPRQLTRFGRLLLLLPCLRLVRSSTVELLFFKDTLGDVAIHRVLADIYSGDNPGPDGKPWSSQLNKDLLYYQLYHLHIVFISLLISIVIIPLYTGVCLLLFCFLPNFLHFWRSTCTHIKSISPLSPFTYYRIKCIMERDRYCTPYYVISHLVT